MASNQRIGAAARDIQLGRDGMADCNWQPVPKRTSIGFHAANVFAVRVPVELGQRLEEGRQILYW